MSLPKPHPSLPAPVVHQSHMTPALSKSHVLAGVQDAYWSDEDADDEECPLCLEEMDISDLGFKPCPCGYQICRFCWNHIKENLNARCPACRREYSEEGIEFKPVNKEDHKRLTFQKKQRERERKDLDALGRRHLTNVRVVQRNVVYVVGLGSRFAKEELIPTLRSSEYFGQYGRITKILLVKRTPPGGRGPVLGLYITYYRREDAARAIAAVDGSPSPSGGGDVMRASYGTTKYCIAFLRGVSCSNHGCMDLHDWGDPKDCFTKEDLTTLKHTMKDTETRSRPTQKAEEPVGLPRTAGWGQRSGTTPTSVSSTAATAAAIPTRSTRRGHRPTRSGTAPEPRPPVVATSKPQQDRKPPPKPPSQASSSRPSTPGLGGLPLRPTTPASTAQAGRSQKPSKEPPRHIPPKSPTGSTFESDPGSQDAGSSPALSIPIAATPPITMPAAPPGLPAAPPGLTNAPPPGLPIPASASVSSPLTRETSGSAYQISTQAQALLDDVMNRRETTAASYSVFPDLDRTLQNLTGGASGGAGGFNFNLDPKLAVDDEPFESQLPDLMAAVGLDANSSFDPFNEMPRSSSFGGPPGLPSQFGPRPTITEHSSSGYVGSFNPFGEANESGSLASQGRPSPHPDDESRRMSRFGFARERQGSNLMNSNTSSPLISANTSLSSMSYHDNAFPTSAGSAHAPWPFQRQHDLVPPGLSGLSRSGTPASMRSSPLVPYAHAQPNVPLSLHGSAMAGQSRFQPFDVSNDASTLKEMLGVGQQQRTGGPSDNINSVPLSSPYSPFQDPAIMSSVSFGSSPMNDSSVYYSPMAMEPPFDSFSSSPFMRNEAATGPPGFQYHQTAQIAPMPTAIPNHSFPPGLLTNPSGMSSMMTSSQLDPAMEPTPPPSFTPLDLIQESSVEPSPMLSTSDFPALPTSGSGDAKLDEETAEGDPAKVAEDEATRIKAERKAAKKAAAAKKAGEREQLAKEKQAEKERIVKEKAEEKARLDKEKAEARLKKKAEEKERLAKEKVEREQAAREKAQREKERLETQKRADAEKAVERAEKAKAQQAVKKVKAEASQNQISPTKTKAGPPTVVAASPMLSKLPKKNKPATKPLKIPKDNDTNSDLQSATASAVTPKKESPQTSTAQVPMVSEIPETPIGVANRASPIREPEIPRTVPKSLAEMLDEIENERGPYYLDDHPLFDTSRINPASKVTLDYDTMSQALSAFPANSGPFSDSASKLNDKTVVCFQQLLETLTQTMSDLVQILPQTTWGSIFDVLSQDLKDLKRDFSLASSTSFDGLVHDDLPADADDDENDEDFDDGDVDEYESGDPPTPTMDKRAKWMEIQLAKLEELHRDVNAAAVRAILMNSDRGWDPKGVLPHASKSLTRFEMLGMVGEGDRTRTMTKDELETKMVVAKEAVVFAETELREAMQALREATV